MRIAIFDLDGTITRHDTLFPYVLRLCMRQPWRALGLLRMPWHLLKYALGGKDRGRLKEALILATFKGVSRADIARWNETFVPRLLHKGVHSQAMARIAAHRHDGDYLILMSASPDLYVPAIARALGMNETICTGVRWDGMRLSGELTTPNRHGEEKLQCLQAIRARWPETQIAAYGNSSFDLPHLKACDRGYLVNAASSAVRAAAAFPAIQIGWPK